MRWISHIKEVLYKCCLYLETLKPESPIDMQSILIHLHTLLEFTATNTWALTRSKNFEKLRGGMTQLCANVMGSLFHKGYYLTLKVRIQESKFPGAKKMLLNTNMYENSSMIEKKIHPKIFFKHCSEAQ